jgi:multidrug efflux system membrane fusion protein
VRAKARFPNAKLALFPNQFVNVRLRLRTVEGAVVVPVNALRHGSSGDFVYVLNVAERTVELRPVTRGEASVDKVAIVAGLRLGENVITEGADRLKDGAQVLLPGDRPASGPGGGARRQRFGASAPASSAAPGGWDASASAPRHRRRPSDAAAE